MKKTNSNFSYFNSLVSLVLDGEASQEERKMFDHYLATSSECRKNYEVEKSFRNLIRIGVRPTSAPQNFAHQIRMNVI